MSDYDDPKFIRAAGRALKKVREAFAILERADMPAGDDLTIFFEVQRWLSRAEGYLESLAIREHRSPASSHQFGADPIRFRDHATAAEDRAAARADGQRLRAASASRSGPRRKT